MEMEEEKNNEKANITDSDGNDVYFGDTFWAYIMRPSAVPHAQSDVINRIQSILNSIKE